MIQIDKQLENPAQEEFEILGETPDLLAVNKPAGLLVHPTKPGGPRTLFLQLRDQNRERAPGDSSFLSELGEDPSASAASSSWMDMPRRACQGPILETDFVTRNEHERLSPASLRFGKTRDTSRW